MADLKISQLNAITVLTPATDVLPVVDSGGVTKKITTNQILGSGGTATLASATITGALTVDTTTLVVDPTNDRVGIGTATPAAKLIVRDGSNRNLLVSSDATQLGSAGIAIGSFTDNAAGYAPLSIIAGTSMAFGMNGSTAMTLNSTGLGVGVSPFYKFQSVGIAAATSSAFNGSGGNLIGALLNSDDANSGANPGVDLRRWTGTALNHGLTYIATNATGDTLFYNGTAASNTRATSLKMTLDASGRLLVGGTGPFGIPNGAGTSFFPLIQIITTSGSAAVSAFVNDGTNNRRIGLFVDNDNGITGISVGRSGGSAPFVYRDATDERLRIDTFGNLITTVPTTPPTLAANSQMVFNLTSNTNLRISVRGTDGVTRTANLTLAP